MIALKLAEKLEIKNFKASNGWLDRFKKRYNLSHKNLSGEANSNDKESAIKFSEEFKEHLKTYVAGDIYNIDETALYYRMISSKSYVTKDDNLKGVKKKKDRVTVLIGCSMTGEMMDPLLIGKYKNPRGLKNVDLSKLGIKYEASPKGWMNSVIFINYLRELNNKMIERKRNILILVDNAPSHSKVEFSNIKLCFLPKNTTALIQPCDQGVIKAFKLHVNNFMNNFIIEKSKDKNDIDECLKEINLHDVCCFVSLAKEKLKRETIINSFNALLNFDPNKMKSPLKDTKEESEQVTDQELTEIIDKHIYESIESDEDEVSKEVDKLPLNKFNSIFSELNLMIKQNCPDKLVEFYTFKEKIIANLKKNSGFGKKIVDYFIKS